MTVRKQRSRLVTEPWGAYVQVVIGVAVGWVAGFGVCYLLRHHAASPWWMLVSGLVMLTGTALGAGAAFACIAWQDRR